MTNEIFVLYIDTDYIGAGNPINKALFESFITKWKEENEETLGKLLVLPKCANLEVIKLNRSPLPKQFKIPLTKEFKFT